MSSKVAQNEFSPMMTSIRDGLERYLPEFSEKGVTVLRSSALAHTAFAILKNVHYSFFASAFGVNDLPHVLSSRVANVETALISAVSAVHNLFFAVFYTLLVVATLGLSYTVAAHCREHWVNGIYGVVTTSIGMVSVLTPYYGTGLNLLFFRSIWRSLMSDYQHDLNLFERPLLRKVKAIWKENRTLIFDFTRLKVGDLRFQNEFKPSLNHIEKKLYESEKMDNLVDLMVDIWRRFPKMVQLETSAGG